MKIIQTIRSLLTALLIFIVITGIAGSFLQANIQKVIEQNHWDRFLLDAWPNILPLLTSFSYANLFWLILGFTAGMWAWQLMPKGSAEKGALAKVHWLSPEAAVNKYSDADLRRERDQYLQKEKDSSTREVVLHKQIEHARIRRQLEDPTLGEQLIQAIHEKRDSHARGEIAQVNLTQDIIQKLLSGDLIARGFGNNIDAKTEPDVIPATQWNILSLDFANKRAIAKGICYSGLQIGKKN